MSCHKELSLNYLGREDFEITGSTGRTVSPANIISIMHYPHNEGLNWSLQNQRPEWERRFLYLAVLCSVLGNECWWERYFASIFFLAWWFAQPLSLGRNVMGKIIFDGTPFLGFFPAVTSVTMMWVGKEMLLRVSLLGYGLIHEFTKGCWDQVLAKSPNPGQEHRHKSN